MSKVTEYQFFLENMKLILRIKKLLDSIKFNEIVEEKIVQTCIEKNVEKEDIDMLRNFIINLEDKSFYDECMKIYLRFSKYDDEVSTINFLHFEKLGLYNFMLDSIK